MSRPVKLSPDQVAQKTKAMRDACRAAVAAEIALLEKLAVTDSGAREQIARLRQMQTRSA